MMLISLFEVTCKAIVRGMGAHHLFGQGETGRIGGEMVRFRLHYLEIRVYVTTR
jgi:hypothetical protein